MTQFMQTVLQISITMAAVIGIMLLLVPVWQNRYSAKWRKLIWLVIAVRLLVPFSIELPEAPVQMSVNFQEAVTVGEQALYVEQTPTIPIAPVIQTALIAPSNNTVHTSGADVQDNTMVPLDWGTVLALIWLAGVLLFLGYHAVQYRTFKRKAIEASQSIEDGETLLHRAGIGLELHHYPTVQFNHFVQSPMLIGFRKPMILIPYRIYGENELVMILRHELIHYKHHDLWYKLILLCANAVHWFNPLVWLMNRQAGRDLEEVCDEYVVSGQDMEYRKAYTMTILNTMANQKGVALSTHLSKDAQNTKKRFSEILHPKQYKKGIAVLLVVLIAIIGASGCLMIRDEDKGQELYRRVASYLSEDAITNPDVYEMTELDNGRIIYTWSEELTEVTDGRVDKFGIGYHDPDSGKNYRYERILMIQTSAENDDIISVTYYRNEDEMTPPVKPSDIGRDIALRDEYIHDLLKDLVPDGEQYTFGEKETIYDTWAMLADSEQRAYYISDNAVNGNYYAIVLNLTYGYVERMYPLQRGEVFSTYVMEGVDERVLSQQLQRYGYYVIDHDPERYGWTHSHNEDDDGFVDTIFPLTMGYNDMHTEPRIEIIYLPDATINNWMDYEETAPRTDLHSSVNLLSQWVNTGETVLLGNKDAYYYPINDGVTVRFPVYWQVWETSTAGGMVNYAYVKEVKDGCMVVKVSYPNTSEYIEGHGTRLHNMAQTFTLDDELLIRIKNE